MRSLLALFLLVPFALAAETKPEGSWTRDTDEVKLTFTFVKDELKILAKVGDTSLNITCSCEVKDGVITAKVKESKAKGDFPELVKADTEMSFKFKIEKDTATLSDFKSKDLAHATNIIEGEYKKKVD